MEFTCNRVGARGWACVILWIVSTGTLCAQSESPSVARVSRHVSDIVIPAGLGYVLERYESQPSSSAPIVVHIQESHADYETQKHLAAILEHLIQRYGLKRILVEGGEGDVGLSYLRGYGPLENRKAIAEKYLKAGLLSGEEYLDIVSDSPLVLWGLEQWGLYDQHVQAFLEVEAIAPSLEALLHEVRDATKALRPTLFGPALIDLMTSLEAFEEGSLDLNDYADRVSNLARDVGISQEPMPQTRRFQRLREIERTLSFERVQQEQAVLLEELGKRLDSKTFNDWMQEALTLERDDPSQEVFYRKLKNLAEASGITSTQYPNLFQYTQYLAEGSLLDPRVIEDELEGSVQRLLNKLADTPSALALSDIEQQRLLVEKFVRLRLSPKEYQRFSTLVPADVFATWNRFLTEQTLAQGLKPPALEGLRGLQDAWPILQNFYAIAMKRDEVLVQGTLAQLSQTQEGVVALITGGFHSPAIAQYLRAQGVGLVVVTPAISEETNDDRYHAVLKYKSGYGRLEDVMALTHQTIVGETLRDE